MAESQGNQPSSSFSPHGRGDDSNSPIIALDEGRAYFMGHYLADKPYGNIASKAIEQSITYEHDSPVTGLSSHLNLLEDFSSQRTTDPFHWIPQRLFYDLMDARNDNTATPIRVHIDDQVSGYTLGQLFNAFQSDITTLQSYRTKLLSLNSNNQAAGVNTIFSFYGY